MRDREEEEERRGEEEERVKTRGEEAKRREGEERKKEREFTESIQVQTTSTDFLPRAPRNIENSSCSSAVPHGSISARVSFIEYRISA